MASERAKLLCVLYDAASGFRDCGLGDNWRKVEDYFHDRMRGAAAKSPRDEILAVVPVLGGRRGNVLQSLPPAAHVVIACLTAAEPDYSPHWWLWSLAEALRMTSRPVIPSDLQTWAFRNEVDLRAPWHRVELT
jgi:hypothetical protein